MAAALVSTLVQLYVPSASPPCEPQPQTHPRPRGYGSQQGQALWVKANTVPRKSRPHFFVDLAANHPTTLSNSVELEREQCWRGICIEASPEYTALLRAQRRCTMVASPIDAVPRNISFEVRGAGSFIKDAHVAVSSLSGQSRQWPKPKPVVHLQTRTLEEVLRSLGAPRVIDYLSLDIEGFEDAALHEHFPFNEYKFLLMTIERPPPELNARLFRNGYLFVHNFGFGGDTYFVHESHPHASVLSRNNSFYQVASRCFDVQSDRTSRPKRIRRLAQDVVRNPSMHSHSAELGPPWTSCYPRGVNGCCEYPGHPDDGRFYGPSPGAESDGHPGLVKHIATLARRPPTF